MIDDLLLSSLKQAMGHQDMTQAYLDAYIEETEKSAVAASMEVQGESFKAARDLIQQVTIFSDPDTEKGIRLEILGELNSVLTLGLENNGISVGVFNGEEGLEPPTRGL